MFSALHLIRAILSVGLLIIFALVGINMGLQQRQRFLDHKKRFLSPVTITMEELFPKVPSEGHFRITGATIRADQAGYTRAKSASENGSDGTAGIRKIAAPVYSREQLRSEDSASLILVTDNLQLRRTINELRRMGLTSQVAGIDDPAHGGDSELKLIAADGSPAAANWMKANPDRIAQTGILEGSVRYFVDLDPDVRDVCRAVAARVGKRHVIMQEGTIPSTEGDGTLSIIVSSLFLFVFSIVMLRLLFALSSSRRQV